MKPMRASYQFLLFSVSQIMGLQSGPTCSCLGSVYHSHLPSLCWEEKPEVYPAWPGEIPHTWSTATAQTMWAIVLWCWPHLRMGCNSKGAFPLSQQSPCPGRQVGAESRASHRASGTIPSSGCLVSRLELSRGWLQDPGLPGDLGTDRAWTGRWGPVSKIEGRSFQT